MKLWKARFDHRAGTRYVWGPSQEVTRRNTKEVLGRYMDVQNLSYEQVEISTKKLELIEWLNTHLVHED